ncbi:MAG: hypothetical protein V6002_00840 [Candidatus Dasytiphilus stammeri]
MSHKFWSSLAYGKMNTRFFGPTEFKLKTCQPSNFLDNKKHQVQIAKY